MKYVVILGDGMADYPQKNLNNKTPLELAKKPFIDGLLKNAIMGECKTVPDSVKPGSDVANLSVLGYDVRTCYTGRSPLEAVSIGISLKDTDVALRTNLVTLSSEPNYEDKTMLDYSAGEISTEEAKTLIEYLKKHLDGNGFSFYAGVSYRHCLIVDNGFVTGEFTPPHDILDRKIKDYLPHSEKSAKYLELMKKSYELLKDHPINVERVKKGKRPANSIWFWGEGTKPSLENFKDKFGVSGVMISAVDLLKGIGILSGMQVVNVKGATGTYETNFSGKAEATLNALKNGADFVYIHMEAPDECGHQGDAIHKIYSIEKIDDVVKTVCTGLDEMGEDYKILILPDHPTPLNLKTHVSDPVPFMIYHKNGDYSCEYSSYTEKNAKATGLYIEDGFMLMPLFING